ncbi:kinesin-like protein KIF20A [Indicator indicator]|uniref:kinesin-like protein KIF20A n=1 Tax=Indicator indicator TaxID=1002788 RepID=UPI0023DECA05|nr:kinesin-like protein KIF20A [Indicator indicator]
MNLPFTSFQLAVPESHSAPYTYVNNLNSHLCSLNSDAAPVPSRSPHTPGGLVSPSPSAASPPCAVRWRSLPGGACPHRPAHHCRSTPSRSANQRPLFPPPNASPPCSFLSTPMDREKKNYVSDEVSDTLGSVSFLNVADDKPSPMESTVLSTAEEEQEVWIGSNQPLKVFLRVRPFSVAELENHKSQGCVTIENPQTVILSAPRESSAMKNSERGISHSVHKFTFSQVFGPETTQREFFEGSMKDIVRAYINGVNGLVFAYGVTNAGKTFTIQGTSKDFGILPRSLDVVFNHIRGRQYLKMNFKPYLSNEVKKLEDVQVKQEEAIKTAILASLKEETESISNTNVRGVESESSNWTSKSPTDSLERNFFPLDIYRTNLHQRTQASVWISFCEIYNEYVYDLLNVFSTSKTQKRRVLRICEDQGGNSYIKDLKWINIQSIEEACKILKIGNKNRSFACTRMNEQSSRSHSIFSIRLLKLTDEHQPRVLGVSELSFCDLAGSERCNKTQAFGDRLKEAGNINNSLHILGKCIAALKQNQNPKMKPSYIPFRESKLTRLFQPFFCGKGKACMIVNINQHAATYDETLHVMKFSAIAKQVIQTILPRSFNYFPPKLVGGDGRAIVHFDANTSTDDFPDSAETSAEEEVDITILSHEDLLKTTENLKEKLVAERQSKLLMEVKIRREMAGAMFQQLLETEEAWSNRLEEMKDSYEEKLESKFEMYKEAIKKHAYVCAMEQIEHHYVPIEEFLAEQEKVEDRESKIRQLERQLDEQSRRLVAVGSLNSDTPTAESNMELDLMNRAMKRANEGLQKQCKEKEELIKSLKFKTQKLNEALLEANEGYKKLAEENSQLKRTITLKDQEMNSLQNWAKRVLELEEMVSCLQKELDEWKKPHSLEEPNPQKPRRGLLANLKSTVAATASTPLGKGWGKHEDASSSSGKQVLWAHKAKE